MVIGDESRPVRIAPLWIGGPAAAGKTTVSRLLARRHGLRWYSVDLYAAAHEDRAAAAGLHVLGTGMGDFDRGPMIEEDLASLSSSVLVVVEGAMITPAMVGPADRALWLMPSRAEQRIRLERRHPEGVHEGYLFGWELITGQLDGADVTVVDVNGQTVEQTLGTVEEAFGAALRTGPTARTSRERRTLIRAGNRMVVEAAMTKLALREPASEAEARTFDCECAEPGCEAFVDVAIATAVAAFADPATPITADGHRPPPGPSS